MACEECARRAVEDNVDGLEQDVTHLRSVQRNQAIVLLITLGAVVLLAGRLAAKGVLSYSELLGDG